MPTQNDAELRLLEYNSTNTRLYRRCFIATKLNFQLQCIHIKKCIYDTKRTEFYQRAKIWSKNYTWNVFATPRIYIINICLLSLITYTQIKRVHNTASRTFQNLRSSPSPGPKNCIYDTKPTEFYQSTKMKSTNYIWNAFRTPRIYIINICALALITYTQINRVHNTASNVPECTNKPLSPDLAPRGIGD